MCGWARSPSTFTTDCRPYITCKGIHASICDGQPSLLSCWQARHAPKPGASIGQITQTGHSKLPRQDVGREVFAIRGHMTRSMVVKEHASMHEFACKAFKLEKMKL